MNAAKQKEQGFVSLKRAPGHREKSAAMLKRVKIRGTKERGTGFRLFQVLNHAMVEKNHSLDDVASAIGISVVYLRALNSGHRRFADVDPDVLRRVATYVNLPVAQVFLLSETLDPEDFFAASTLGDELAQAYRSMTLDPKWSGYVPATEDWDAMSERTKLFMCMMYEVVSNQNFLTKARIDPPQPLTVKK
jgi:transcriptional regulator with XRE-family HTH domain